MAKRGRIVYPANETPIQAFLWIKNAKRDKLKQKEENNGR